MAYNVHIARFLTGPDFAARLRQRLNDKEELASSLAEIARGEEIRSALAIVKQTAREGGPSVHTVPLDHVTPMVDAMLEAAIQAAEPLANALGAVGAKAVRIELAGHVETKREHLGHLNVHVWPVD